MKKILIVLGLIIINASSKASIPALIPNSGFESWFTTTWYDFPAQWMTSNNQLLPSTVVKDTDAHSGNLAMQLAYAGSIIPHAWCDFLIFSHPQNLGGFIKNGLNPNDSIVIVVRIYYQQQLVDSGFGVVYGGIYPNWSTFTVPISQNSALADSCEISFEGSYLFQSSASFDDLEFDVVTNTSEPSLNLLSVYPNPCNGHFIINNRENNPYEISIYDMNGQECMLNNDKSLVVLPRNHKLVNIENISQGNYIIVLKNGNEKRTISLLKN